MATALERQIRSVQTTNPRSARQLTEVSQLEDLKRALQGPVQSGALAIAGSLSEAELRQAEDAALAATEEEIVEDARGIRDNPFKASLSPHAARLFNTIAAGRAATAGANDLIEQINADPDTLADADAVDARIAALREQIGASSRTGFEGAALDAFDRAVLPLQNRSAEAQTARVTAEGEAQVGVAIHSLITNARESSIGMEDEERQEFYAEAVEEAAAMLDAKEFIGISREAGIVSIVNQAIAESILNPEDFDMVVEELTKELVIRPSQVKALNNAVVSARRKELEQSNAEGRAISLQHTADEREAADLVASSRLAGGTMPPAVFEQVRRLSPRLALEQQNFERKESGLQSDIIVAPEVATGLDLLLYSDQTLDGINTVFQELAFAGEIPFSTWESARKVLREREKPNGLLTNTVYRTERSSFISFLTGAVDPEGLKFSEYQRRFNHMAASLEGSLVDDAAEHVLKLGAGADSLKLQLKAELESEAKREALQKATKASTVVSVEDLRTQVDILETVQSEMGVKSTNAAASLDDRLKARLEWINVTEQLHGPATGLRSLSIFGIGGKQGELADAIERDRRATGGEITFTDNPIDFILLGPLPDLTDKVRITKEVQARINAEHQRREAARQTSATSSP